MRSKCATASRRVAERAAVQHGIVTHAQLLEAGLSRAMVTRWTKGGRLHRMHRGVFALGHSDVGLRARWIGAVLACGEGAVLSHAGAAALWDLIRPVDGPVDVSVPTENGRKRRAGIRIHRRAALARLLDRGQPPLDASGEPLPAPLVVRDGIPVTAPWLTIDDLRTTVPARVYRHAVRQAELRNFVLSPRTQRDRTRSDVEREFLELCSVAFEDDHQRDLDLRRRGYAVHRYTDLQLEREPARIAADLAAALEATVRRYPGPQPTPRWRPAPAVPPR